MPLVDCLGAVANALQIKEVTDKVDALVKKGKHPAEAEAIAKREFVSDEFGKLNDELNGIKKEVGVKAGKAEKLKPVNFSELNKKYKADKEAATAAPKKQEDVGENIQGDNKVEKDKAIEKALIERWSKNLVNTDGGVSKEKLSDFIRQNKMYGKITQFHIDALRAVNDKIKDQELGNTIDYLQNVYDKLGETKKSFEDWRKNNNPVIETTNIENRSDWHKFLKEATVAFENLSKKAKGYDLLNEGKDVLGKLHKNILNELENRYIKNDTKIGNEKLLEQKPTDNKVEPEQKPEKQKDNSVVDERSSDAVNKVFDKTVSIGGEKGFHTEESKVYRVTQNSQIEDIINNGTVRPPEGKMRGGKTGEVHWAKGNKNLNYTEGDGKYILEVDSDKIAHNQKGALSVNDLSAIWKFNKESNKWENVLSEIKEKQKDNSVVGEEAEKKPINTETDTKTRNADKEELNKTKQDFLNQIEELKDKTDEQSIRDREHLEKQVAIIDKFGMTGEELLNKLRNLEKLTSKCL